MAAIWSSDHEAGNRADTFMVGSLQTEALDQAGQPRGLTVVTPADGLSVDECQEPSHLASIDHAGHVAAVVGSSPPRPLVVGLGAVGLHAVARLPRRVIPKGIVVKERLVLPYPLRCYVLHLDVADFRKTGQCGLLRGVKRQA